MKPLIPSQARGLSLAEVMVTLVVITAMMIALMAGVLSLSSSFASADDYSRAQEDQLNLSDFLSLDLRRATNIVTSNDTNVLLRVEIPTYTNNPTITSDGRVTYGTTPTTITYTRSGSDIRRTESNSVTNITIRVARDVSDFDVTSTNNLAAGGVAVASNRIVFDPRFRFPHADYNTNRQLTAVQSYLLLRARKYQSDATTSNSVPVNP